MIAASGNILLATDGSGDAALAASVAVGLTAETAQSKNKTNDA